MRGMPGWQPSRLKEARIVRGLSQAALAVRIDRSPASVSKWEKEIDGQSPDEQTFLRLAEILKVRPAFLVRDVPEHGQSAFFFREMSSNWKSVAEREKVRLRWLQEISLAVQQYVDLPELNLPDVLNGREFLELDERDIELAAEKVRRAWGLNDGPIADVLLAIENAGIVVGYDVVGSAKMDGLCNWSTADSRPYILIAEDKYSAVRSRMDACHELGHVFLHAHLNPETQRKHHKQIEQQAWRFAAAFLMPSTTFSSDIGSLTLNGFLALKDRWKVAISAMIMRCAHLEIIDDEQKSRLFRNLSVRGWRKSEPLDDSLGIERPRLLRRSIELICDSGVRTRSDLSDVDIGLSAEDIEQLANLTPGFFSSEATSFAAPKIKPDYSNSNVLPFPRSD